MPIQDHKSVDVVCIGLKEAVHIMFEDTVYGNILSGMPATKVPSLLNWNITGGDELHFQEMDCLQKNSKLLLLFVKKGTI